jgi:hypothetical protein
MRDLEPQINNPTIVGRLTETLNYLSTLERHCSDMQDCITGPVPEANSKRDHATTIDQMTAEICERTANLCGWLSSIKNRIGVPGSNECATQAQAAEYRENNYAPKMGGRL